MRPKHEAPLLKSESLSPASRRWNRNLRRLKSRAARGAVPSRSHSTSRERETSTLHADDSDDGRAVSPGSKWSHIDPNLTLGDLLPTKFADLTDQELIEAGMKLPDIINSGASMADYFPMSMLNET